jgi:ribose transport system substrate-binding protein
VIGSRSIGRRAWAAGVVALGAFGLAAVHASAGPAAHAASGERPGSAPPAEFEALREDLRRAATASREWAGPRSGPPALQGKSVAVVCEDLRNGGVLGVALGIVEAARVIGWTLRIYDADGTADGRLRALADARASRPDGLVLVGSDAEGLRPELERFGDTPIVGWHVGPRAGAMAGPVAINVSTDPVEVARIAATAAVVDARGRGGFVIFEDPNFEIARTKARVMTEVVRACPGCTLLEVTDVAISESSDETPRVVDRLLAASGARWTAALAINDIYFDDMVPRLVEAGLPNDQIRLYSAGDGSSAALMRLRAGVYQEATVAEPLRLHGWQLIDELNRLFAHEPVSGYVVPVHLITRANIVAETGSRLMYDPENGYRESYQRIWFP